MSDTCDCNDINIKSINSDSDDTNFNSNSDNANDNANTNIIKINKFHANISNNFDINDIFSDINIAIESTMHK